MRLALPQTPQRTLEPFFHERGCFGYEAAACCASERWGAGAARIDSPLGIVVAPWKSDSVTGGPLPGTRPRPYLCPGKPRGLIARPLDLEADAQRPLHQRPHKWMRRTKRTLLFDGNSRRDRAPGVL